MLAATANLVTLWNVADAMPIARLATQTEFVLPPVFSSDGGYVAIAERVEEARPLYSLLRAQDGSLLASIEGLDRVRALVARPGRTLFRVARAEQRAADRRRPQRQGARRAQHAHDVARVLPLPDGASLITVDAAGEIRAWRVDAADGAAGRRLGEAAAADAVSVSNDGTRLAYPTGRGEIVVRDVASGARLATLRDGVAGAARCAAPRSGWLATRRGERRARSLVVCAERTRRRRRVRPTSS